MTSPATVLDGLVGLTRKACALALEAKVRSGREVKPDGSLVTKADLEVERFFRRTLPDLAPGTAVWGEEEGFSEPGPEGLWLIDPIDGTSNYTFGLPLWGITVALYRDGACRVGVVALPELDMLFAAAMGEGATLNGGRLPPIRPGPVRPYELVGHADDEPGEFCAFPGKPRHLGAFVAEAMYVASGTFRAMTSTKCKLYDAAGSLVVLRELGAEVLHADGRPFVDAEWVRPVRCDPFAVLPPGSGLLQGRQHL
jgi:myo-inositol-1(or 4)-monophosphatase